MVSISSGLSGSWRGAGDYVVAYVSSFLLSVVRPLFDGVGLGFVIAGLMVFVVSWAVFMAVIGRKE